jgi:hypothetical protein
LLLVYLVYKFRARKVCVMLAGMRLASSQVRRCAAERRSSSPSK